MTRALGFRVKSGYAIAVVLRGPAERPTAVERRIVELSDPDDGETRQPFHSGFGEAEEDERKIARRLRAIERAAGRSVAALVDGRFVGASIVVGSLIDPATVGNPHIRAHASEGRLFRTVLEEALRARGVECAVVVEKQLAADARGRLKLGDVAISRALAGFGKALGSPWRVDEKAAATGAWMALMPRRP
jgi:hypothetical protein